MDKQLQNLYDSEINCKLSWTWDEGVNWYLGDNQNGWKDQGYALTMREAISALYKAATKCYPNSTFTRNFQIASKKEKSIELLYKYSLIPDEVVETVRLGLSATTHTANSHNCEDWPIGEGCTGCRGDELREKALYELDTKLIEAAPRVREILKSIK